MAADNHLLPVAQYNVTTIMNTYYVEFFEKGQQKINLNQISFSRVSVCCRKSSYNLLPSTYRWLIYLVHSDNFFHPDHIIPAAKLISAFAKFSDFFKAKMGVKLSAVFVEILIFHFRITNTGIQIQNAHIFKLRF